ncbi:MAG: nuclear transport factor 2 family protein [Pyrinomonadaceae bacterium]
MKNPASFIFAVLASCALALMISGCQQTAPDANRSGTIATNANLNKEGVDRAAIEGALAQLEREWAAATGVTHEVEVLKRIEADDIHLTYPDGSTGTRDDDIRDVTSGSLTADAWEVPDITVTVLDANTAVVTGRSLVKNGKYKRQDGKMTDISGEYRFTDVFAKRNGNWQAIASQATRILNPAPAPSPNSSPTMTAAPTRMVSPAANVSPKATPQ